MEHGFEEAFFESSGDEEEEKESVLVQSVETTKYKVRECEPEWFLTPRLQQPVACGWGEAVDRCAEHESSFMPVKYAADLFYYRSQFDQAAACYLQALSMAPEGYSMVRRELMDGLARCRLKMGRVGEALEVAKQLVLVPADGDASSWKLLAACHEYRGDVKGQVLALQKCASVQRHFPFHWTELAAAYQHLSPSLTSLPSSSPSCHPPSPSLSSLPSSSPSCHPPSPSLSSLPSSSPSCHPPSPSLSSSLSSSSNGKQPSSPFSDSVDDLRQIVLNAVSLLRPYFKWDRSTLKKSCIKNGELCSVYDDGNERSDGDGEFCFIEEQSSARERELSSIVESDSVELCSKQLSSVALSDDREHTKSCVCECQHLKVGAETVTCSLSPEAPESCVELETSKTGSARMTHSLDELPFTWLMTGLCSADGFLERVQSASADDGRKLLRAFFNMASCGSLIWARQLLGFSTMHSESFVKSAQSDSLQRAEQLLHTTCGNSGGYHGNTRQYLWDHFKQIKVFDDPN